MSVIMNQKKEILEKLAFIRRHKEFASFGVKEQEVSYNPCLSEEDIKEFEHKHCITLPDDYRTFISEIGNGGFGPGYGLLPLDKAIVDFKLRDKPNISLNEKFPYQDSWNEEWITPPLIGTRDTRKRKLLMRILVPHILQAVCK